MWRRDFPIMQDEGLVYLDSAASTQKPGCVLDAMAEFYRSSYANVHRSIYPLSERATLGYENARKVIAGFINTSADRIVFVKNATEAINLVAHSLFKGFFRPGDVVLTTIMEHHSNFVPWQQLAKENNIDFEVLPVNIEGKIDLDELNRVLKRRVKILVLTHVSNVLGTINPVKEITALAHEVGALVLVDGAQAVAHMPVDVGEIGADFYVFSGHKLYGPDGIGVLYGRKELLESLPPFLFGGDMIREVHIKDTLFNSPPHKFEAGTPPIAQAIGLAKAVAYLQEKGFDAVEEYEDLLMREAFDLLSSVGGLEIYGPKCSERKGVISFNLADVHPHDVASVLGATGVCVRAGHHCAQPLHDFLGVPASVRVSLGVYNTSKDLEVLAKGLKEVKHVFLRTA